MTVYPSGGNIPIITDAIVSSSKADESSEKIQID